GGIQVFDLAALDAGGPVVEHPPVTAGAISSAHNVVVDTDAGFLYAVGHDRGSRGMVIYDLLDPAAPLLVSSFGPNYVHDAQVLVMPDGPWAGHEIGFLASGRTGLQIVDLTDKTSPWMLAELPYEGVSYAHQCWYDPATQLLYLGDESDERGGLVDSTTTYVFDVSDLTAPVLLGTFTNGLPSIDHNLHVVNGVVFEANYTSGLRIFDARIDPVQPPEVGFVDTWPASDRTSFDGAWGVFADFPSGRVLVNDGDFGLFVVDPTAALTAPPDALLVHRPLSDAIVSPTVERLTWHKSWGSLDYLVEVGRDPAMADLVWSGTTEGLAVELRDAELPGCEGFWWTVTARGPHGDTRGPVRPFTTAPLGELSGDAVVDDTDLSNLRYAWMWGHPHGDLDRDGAVTEADREILLANWGACPE
ncbi:MAG: choice-of-anchor B domain-containing protein, partial [Myxococcota bacterium]